MSKKIWFGILAIVLVFGMAVIGCGPSTSERNLVGIWELEDAVNISRRELLGRIDFFSGGTGVVYERFSDTVGDQITWQIIDGNRLLINTDWGSQIHDFDLSEGGTLLTLHLDGRDFGGERPRKSILRKR